MKKLIDLNYQEGSFYVYNDKPNFEIIECKQVHSNIVLPYQGENLKDTEADDIIIDPSLYKNVCLAIKTADCLPILLIGKRVGLIHAGWKGIANNIFEHPLLAQKNNEFHTAYIGPSIHRYSVTEEFRSHFPASKNFYHKDTLCFNLQEEAKEQLVRYFPTIKVEISPICTLGNIDYNSYRRNKTKIRNWNLFKLN